MSNPTTTGERFVMRDHAIFDTQADAFIGAGDACYLLNESNDAEREKQKHNWNVIVELREQLAAATARELHSYDVAKLCRDELAAEREKLERIKLDWPTTYENFERIVHELREQLAAEKARHNDTAKSEDQLNTQLAEAVESLKKLQTRVLTREQKAIVDAALAKIGGKP